MLLHLLAILPPSILVHLLFAMLLSRELWETDIQQLICGVGDCTFENKLCSMYFFGQGYLYDLVETKYDICEYIVFLRLVQLKSISPFWMTM